MTVDLTTLDAHEQPSDELRHMWKKYSRTDHKEFIEHPDIDDLHSARDNNGPFEIAGNISRDRLLDSFKKLEGHDWQADQEIQDAPIYFHPLLPGIVSPFFSLYISQNRSLIYM